MAGSRLSRCLYYTFRNVAKIVVGIRHQILNRDVEPVEGDCHCSVAADLGERRYKELCEDGALSLEMIVYCQSELSAVTKSLQASRRLVIPGFDDTEQRKRFLNHDFLILKLQPRDRDVPPLHIWAEKVGEDHSSGEDRPGIHISLCNDVEDVEQRCSLLKIACGCSVSLPDILSILQRQGPNYDERNDNFWDYTRETTKWLLEACIQDCRTRARDKMRLQAQVTHLEANLFRNHAINTVQSAAEMCRNLNAPVQCPLQTLRIVHRCSCGLR